MEDEGQMENDRQRAEVFDALGHPTRIVILKALSEGALGFADLKKKTDIESSGHLQHHLTKLNGLIKTDEYGKYCLSSEGKDALLTVQTVEKSSVTTKDLQKHPLRFNKKTVLKSVSLLLVALLIASSVILLFKYNQTRTLQKEIAFLNGADPEAVQFYNEFRIIPTTNVNSTFSPPFSMYHALLIGFAAGGWNKTSLQGMIVSIDLMHLITVTNETNYAGAVQVTFTLNEGFVTSQPTNYSDVYGNGAIYRYVWQIDIQESSLMGLSNSVPPRQILVDAATGAIVPNG
ncbi:MAG: winged helix-turn-helix domain-containing protein [Candidatus Bathyarchaeia archaeon]